MTTLRLLPTKIPDSKKSYKSPESTINRGNNSSARLLAEIFHNEN